MNKRRWMGLLILFVAVMVIMNLVKPVSAYISEVKRNKVQLAFQRMLIGSAVGEVESLAVDQVDTLKTNTPQKLSTDAAQLKQQIHQEALNRRIAPIDARVDRVWKLIPGYNGLEVDEEQTFQLAKSKGKLDETSYVFREISPKVSLEALGAHPIYRGNPQKAMVSLMINVAWGNEFLDGMLETLAREKVKATFFFDGTWLSKNEELAKRIRDEGHEVSNHAYSHKNMSTLSRYQAEQEIVKTEQLIATKLGVTNKLFAPPSGDFDQETVEIAASLKLQTILWTLDTVDWKNPGKEAILNKISTRLEAGSTILMHPTVSSSGALERMIQIIKNKGLAIGTVSELISPKRVPGVRKVK
ncbi:polysaccharide deacetylase family protein [Paenibacillus sp. KN14-4R]|uniref:polysaccharide deacetylase family protein n=1 Tax=Paenibacillus sp. KN14-4R TaxID=3445773 RepID=UPI003FA13FFD